MMEPSVGVALVVGAVVVACAAKVYLNWSTARRVRKLRRLLAQWGYRPKPLSTSSRTVASKRPDRRTGSQKRCRCKTSGSDCTPSPSSTPEGSDKPGSKDSFQPKKGPYSRSSVRGVTPPRSSPKNTG